jgi:hypothetical protein
VDEKVRDGPVKHRMELATVRKEDGAYVRSRWFGDPSIRSVNSRTALVDTGLPLPTAEKQAKYHVIMETVPLRHFEGGLKLIHPLTDLSLDLLRKISFAK